MDNYILDDAGNPVPEPDLLTWGRWFETADRILARDQAGPPSGRLLVSTVFLGIDHNFGFSGDGPPILWETAVWSGENCDITNRYATRAAALAGHREQVRLLLEQN